MLGIGIDVERVTFNKWGQGYTATVTLDFKNIGFQHVRIRVAGDSTETIALLHRVVDDCFKMGLIPIPTKASTSTLPSTGKHSVDIWG